MIKRRPSCLEPSDCNFPLKKKVADKEEVVVKKLVSLSVSTKQQCVISDNALQWKFSSVAFFTAFRYANKRDL